MAEPAPITVTRGEYRLTTERGALDRAAIHAGLALEHWAQGISRERVDRIVEHSLCWGLFHGPRQIGFIRAVTDYCTFAYLNDMYILAGYRGRGLSVWMMETVLAHPGLQGLKRICLSTRDAAGLHRRFGFTDFRHPERWLEVFDPAAYEHG